LHNINFNVRPGQVVALVGSSGSGKSTIAGLAASFLNPVSGTITIDGQDLSQVNLKSYRKHLGVVLQDEFLFEGSIRSEEHTSELQSRENLVCRLLLEKKKRGY